MANSLVKGEKKQPSFSVFLTQDAIKKKINEVFGGKGGPRLPTPQNCRNANQCLSLIVRSWARL